MTSSMASAAVSAKPFIKAGSFNPTSPRFLANPYPIYHQLRAVAPILRNAQGSLYLSTYADVSAVLSDTRFGKDFENRLRSRRGPEILEEPVYANAGRWMIEMDPPNQSRIQSVAIKGFSGPRIRQLRQNIETTVGQLLDRVESAGRMDVVNDFAYRIPALTMCNLLGIPEDDRDHFLALSAFDPGMLETFPLPREELDRANQNCLAQAEYLDALIDQRRQHPSDDLISLYVQDEDKGIIDRREHISLLNMLVIAGLDTTNNFIGNALLALFQNRPQLDLLRSDPTLLRQAFDECLRYDPSIQMIGRTALCDAHINGLAVAAGTNLICLVGAANRDPEIFPEPDRLDIQRHNAKRHLSFSRSIHSCIGQSVAWLEFEAGIFALLSRFPDFELDAPFAPKRLGNFIFRGLAELPAHWN